MNSRDTPPIRVTRNSARCRTPLLSGLRALGGRRHLLLVLAAREVRDRYAGSLFGLLWAVFQPVALVGILIVVFTFAIGSRLAATPGAVDYTAYVVAGFLPWMAISGGLQAAAGSVRANPSLVKQIDFPLEVLPVKAVLSQTVGQLIGLVLLVTYLVVRDLSLPVTLLLVVPAFVLQVVLTIGIGWILAVLATYFRDLEHALPALLMLNMYLLPIFFLEGATPEVLRPVIDYNPFTPVVHLFQDAIVFGEMRHASAWVATAVAAVLAFEFGFRLFQRARSGFGDLV